MYCTVSITSQEFESSNIRGYFFTKYFLGNGFYSIIRKLTLKQDPSWIVQTEFLGGGPRGGGIENDQNVGRDRG